MKGLEQGLGKGITKGEKKKAIQIAKNLIGLLDTKTIAAKKIIRTLSLSKAAIAKHFGVHYSTVSRAV